MLSLKFVSARFYVAVTVEIASCNRKWHPTRRESPLGLKSAITIAQKNGHGVVIQICHRQVSLSIGVEVCHGERDWISASDVDESRLEGAVTVA